MNNYNNNEIMNNNQQINLNDNKNGLLPGNKIMIGGTPVKFDKNFMAKYKGIKNITDQQMALVLTKAYANNLNPITDLDIVAFGSTFNIIEKVENKLKRAQATGKFKGIEQGIYVINKDGELEKRNNEIFVKGYDQKLVGAWASVNHEDFGKVAKDVNFDEYNKGKSTWKDIPVTMIVKVARGQALDLAFPNLFNGFYSEEEVSDHKDATIYKSDRFVDAEIVEQDMSNLIEQQPQQTQPEPQTEPQTENENIENLFNDKENQTSFEFEM